MMFLIRKPLFSLLMPLVIAGCASGPDLAARITGRSESVYKETFLSARMAEQKGELLKATQNYELLLKKHPQKAELHHRLGILSQKSGRPEQAVNYLNQAHQLAPMDVEILCDLGYSHYLQGNADEAVKVFQQAQQINPGHARTQSNLAIALIELNQVPAAMSLLRQGMGEAAAATTVGFALAQKGELNEAQRYFSQALDTDADNQQAAEALVQIEALLESQKSAESKDSVASNEVPVSGSTGDAPLATVDTDVSRKMQVITESESFDTIGLTALTADAQASQVSPAATVSTSERVLSTDVINAAELRLIGADQRGTADTSVGSAASATKVQQVKDESRSATASPIVAVSDAQQVSPSSFVELSGSILKNPESRRESSEPRGVWRSAQGRRGSEVESRSDSVAASRSGGSESQLSEFTHGSPIESIHDAGRSSRKATVIEPLRMADREQYMEDDLYDPEYEQPVVTRGPRVAERRRSRQAGNGWSQRNDGRENSADSPTSAPPMIVVSGQAFDYERLAQLAATGQLQLSGLPGSQSLPQQIPSVTQVAYTAPPTAPSGVQGGTVVPGIPQAGLVPVPSVVAPLPLVTQLNAGATVPVEAAIPATGLGVQPMPQNSVAVMPTVVNAGSMAVAQVAPQLGTVLSAVPVTGPSQPVQTATAGSAVAALPVVYAQGQQVRGEAVVPARISGPQETLALPAMPPMVSPALTSAAATPPALDKERTGGSAQAQSQVTAATGTVGGLPLAFLRSFYSQMPQNQQATFWRDLRQLPGAVSPAELAAYRELALSATDLARVEAAITMLAVYKQRDLAEDLLKGMNTHADPVVQQSALTALSMLQIQQPERK